MNIEELREYCLSKKGTTESFPFDETTLVFKVMNKMFAVTDLEKGLSVSIKCDPELAINLRERYPAVMPAWHFNKVHWNNVIIDGSVDVSLIREWIDHSYDLIVSKLPKKDKKVLGVPPTLKLRRTK
ncbi:MAG: MmcQ/YjbR family DNA-binding protein [Bacteroidales bacterium]|nr:MmcQ/YjbR family DNA-binding protein [Bacteroidales bacterium]